MKRTLIAPLALGLLTACAGGTALGATGSDTPAQSLRVTGKAMSNVQSLRFDLNGTVVLTLPQKLIDQLRAKGGSQGAFLSSHMTVTLNVTGQARRPDQIDANVTAKLGGLTLKTEVIATGGKLYYQDPMTGKWEVGKRPHPETSGSSKPKLSYQSVLDTAKSLTEIASGPSNLDGVPVDHYRVVPDLARLFAQVTADHTARNPQALEAIQAILQSASLTADVWTGTGDHLVRRVSYDIDSTADLGLLASIGAKPGSTGQGPTLPAGSMAHLTAHVVINLHDFNAPVTIKAPAIAS